MNNDQWWALLEPRLIELDEIRDDRSRPLFERAEAEARRAELSRVLGLISGQTVTA